MLETSSRFSLSVCSRYENRKRQKKEQEKLKRKEAQAEKIAKTKEIVSAMNEEELAAWRGERAARVADRQKEKIERKARMEQALLTGQRIVIDLEFPDLMSEGELRSMAQQVTYCYAINTRTSIPANLILSGFHGKTKEFLEKQAEGCENWLVTRTEKTYLEHFEGSKDDLVYLTADSPNELQELDPSKAYIVGGIVDRNRHKGLCFNKAEAQGVATARLPLGEYIKLASSTVMCTNHVVEIMLRWLELRDWEAAFKAAIPTRKRKERVDEGGSDGGVGGESSEGGEEKKEDNL